MNNTIKYNIGIISGYFNPLHFGHIEYINAAKNRCEELVVIVNNDHQVDLKRSKPFMKEIHRANIMHSIKGVDFSLISQDFDHTVCETIRYIKSIWPDKSLAFFNSGDRIASTVDPKEKSICEELNIDFIVLGQPKIYSSSELLKNI
jgi:cytidyltransferase-like protein